jgi:hypothetical protein
VNTVTPHHTPAYAPTPADKNDSSFCTHARAPTPASPHSRQPI